MSELTKVDNTSLTTSNAMISVIERAAINPDVDMDKMERLLAMQERIFAKNAEIAFNQAMSEVQREVPQIKKRNTNQQTRSTFARLEDINKELTPVYTAHGFALSFGTADSTTEGWIRTTCKVTHTEGHSKDFFVDLPVDDEGAKGNVNKTKMHGAGSTMSYARRYLTLLIFNIALTDEDNDGNVSSTSIIDRMFVHNVAVRENLQSILAIKDGIFDKDYSTTREAWKELSKETMEALWLAPTKGGIFTTYEIKRLKMSEREWDEAQ
jgi:hypothetical protein